MKSILLAIILSGLFGMSYAQNEPIPSIELVNGNNTLKGLLPYGQPFTVTGDAKIPSGESADLIALTIREFKSLDSITTVFWWNSDASKTGFSLYINESLMFETKYSFQFTFYKKDRISSSLAAQLATQIVEEVYYELSNQPEISQSQVKDLLEFKLKQKIQSDANYVDLGSLNQFFYPTEIEFGSELKDYINRITRQSGRFSTVKELETKLEVLKKSFGLKLVKDVIKDLRSLPDSVEIDTTLIKNLDSIKTLNDLAEFNVGYLESIFPEISSINSLISARSHFLDQKQALQESKQLFEQNDNTSDLEDFISEIAIGINKVAELNTMSSSSPILEADLAVTRWSLAYGGGLVGFYSESQDSWSSDAISYLALKYYLSPVDKRLADPYLRKNKAISTASFMVGFLPGAPSLKYKGQSQQKIGNWYPVLGFGFDFLRYFSVDIGTVFFRQPSLSSVDSSSNPKAAPFLGISLDPDAFNRVKSLITNQEYKLPK